MANDILSKLTVFIDANTQGINKGMAQLNNNLNGFKRNLAQQTTSIQSFQKQLSGVQSTLAGVGLSFGAFAIAGIVKSAVNSIADFERQIDEVAAVSGATGEQISKLRDDALRLGASTRFTATEIAKLQTELGRLGFSSDEILNATDAITKLAVATNEDLAKSADVVGSTVRAFGLDATEAIRVVDVMALSFNKSALQLDNFTDSMKYVAPIARSANISIEETTALLGVLADSGIRGSQAGTGLRRIITDLAKDGRPLSERLKELADRGLTFSGAMDEVGRFAQSALLVLSRNTDRIKEFSSELDNAAGSANRMAAIMQDNLTGDIIRLTSAYDGLVQSFSDGSPVLREIVQNLTSIVNGLTEAAKSADGFLVSWLKLVSVVPRTALKVGAAISDLTSDALSEEDIKRLQAQLKTFINVATDADQIDRAKAKLKELIEAYGDLTNEITTLGPDPAKPFELSFLFDNIQQAAEKKSISIKFPRVDISASEINVDELLKDFKDREDKLFKDQVALTVPIEVDIPPENTEQFDAFIDKLAETRAEIEAENERIQKSFDSTFKQGLTNTIVAFAEDLGEAAAGVGNFGDSILEALASFAKQFGAVLIAAGVAKIAFENLAISGYGAVIAGAALIAAASAVSATLSKSSQPLTSSSAGQTRGSSFNTQSFGTPQSSLVTKIQGQDLLVILNNTLDNNRQRRGG